MMISRSFILMRFIHRSRNYLYSNAARRLLISSARRRLRRPLCSAPLRCAWRGLNTACVPLVRAAA